MTPRWSDDPVRRLDMLGQRRLMPRWTDNPGQGRCLSVCWSVLYEPIACSLLGGGSPIPEQRL